MRGIECGERHGRVRHSLTDGDADAFMPVVETEYDAGRLKS